MVARSSVLHHLDLLQINSYLNGFFPRDEQRPIIFPTNVTMKQIVPRVQRVTLDLCYTKFRVGVVHVNTLTERGELYCVKV